MKYCRHCKVSVTGQMTRCPLCQNTLRGESSLSAFPVVEQQVSRKLFLRLMLFFSILVMAVCVIINLMLPHTGAWSLFVIAGVVCMWISLGIALLKRRSILKNIVWQTFIISALAMLWDYFTGWYGWSVNFVVPIVLFITMLLTPLLAHILKVSASAYVLYFCIVCLFGLVPVVFLLLDLVTIPLPSLICVGVGVVSFIALMIFSGRAMREELHRRLHL